MDIIKIFIVEGDSDEALNLKNILAQLGYAVVGQATTGEECLAMVSVNQPDLIIMNIHLHGALDGIDTAWELRSVCDAPIIFTTAISGPSSLGRAKMAEPYGYIVKPFSESELYTTIETSMHRFRIDRRLKESETKYRALFEQSRDAIFISDMNGIITDINAAMVELSGRNKEFFFGKSMDFLFADNAEGGDVLREIGGKGYIENREFRLVKQDGSESHCLLTGARIVSYDGAVFGYQGIIRDITSHKRLEMVKDKLFFEKIKRVKELNCLYHVADISGAIETPIDEICRKIVEILPSAFQSPGAISVRIIWAGTGHESVKFKTSGIRVFSPVRIFGLEEGLVELFYTDQAKAGQDEFFSKEDRDLINAVAERLGLIIERKRTFDELSASREEMRSLSSHLQSLREQERKDIAREIHDVLGQSLTAMKMDAAWLKNRLAGNEELVTRAAAMADYIDGTIDTVRKISSELRPGLIDDIGLCAALEWHAEEFQNRTGIVCRFTTDAEDIEIGEMKSINIYRIVQESLTNIIRHANASEVEVRLMKKTNGIKLTISDNGKGISDNDINSPTSLGLVGIRERAHYCGGTMSIEGGTGTVVNVVIPLGKEI